MRDPPLDYETVRRARDESAISHEVWRRVCAEIYRVVVALLGEACPDRTDVTQNVFVKVYQELDDFKPQDPGSFSGWIRTIARHTTLDHCRRSRIYDRVFSHDSETVETMEYQGPYDGAQLERFQDEALLRAAFAALPPEFRFPLHLRYTEEKSIQETAAELGLPVGTVKSRCNRAAKMIREHIDEASRSATDLKARTRT